MAPKDFDIMKSVTYDIAWCPGCGNYAIRQALMGVLAEQELSPQDVVMVSGIGQAAKMPHYIRVNYFNGLHGRSLPAATGIKAANPGLTVIAESGDGCSYGEGGNHLTHTIARNPDVALIAHNNMVYGLTKGQASPTSRLGFVTPLQPADRGGVTNEPFNPLSFAVALDASFVARGFAGDTEHLAVLLKMGIEHHGFAFIDMENDADASTAIQQMNGFSIKERKLIVNEARPRKDKDSRGTGRFSNKNKFRSRQDSYRW